MQRYQPMNFRPSFGAAALGLSALTMTLAIGVPAALSKGDPMAPTAVVRDATWVTIEPSHVDAVGVRETDVALTRARPAGRRG